MSNSVAALEAMNHLVGEPQGTGTGSPSPRIRSNQFADVTHDHQFIHIDAEKAAAESPFGGRSPTGSSHCQC